MNDKKFNTILAVISAIGIITSAILVGYTMELYEKCSIISYIANEEI